jgi:hypothetical protein
MQKRGKQKHSLAAQQTCVSPRRETAEEIGQVKSLHRPTATRPSTRGGRNARQQPSPNSRATGTAHVRPHECCTRASVGLKRQFEPDVLVEGGRPGIGQFPFAMHETRLAHRRPSMPHTPWREGTCASRPIRRGWSGSPACRAMLVPEVVTGPAGRARTQLLNFARPMIPRRRRKPPNRAAALGTRQKAPQLAGRPSTQRFDHRRRSGRVSVAPCAAWYRC